MKIDLQTLKELELFNYDAHGLSIFELLDETSTPGGQYKLKQNFRKPIDKLEKLKNTQEAVRHIFSEIEQWELPVDGKLMDLLDVYYFSKSKPLVGKNVFARFFENISYRFIYKDFNATFLEGTRHVISFLKSVTKFHSKHTKKELPYLLKDFFSQISDIIEHQSIQEALKSQSVKNIPTLKLLQLDKAFRDTHKNLVLKLIDLVYDLDVLISKARSCKKYQLVFPEFVDSDKAQFEFQGLYHLFVKNPVTNELDFVDNKNFIFLTGPNMAGKTTFLKACGVAVFLAHLGMGVPAESMKLSLFDRIFTSLNVSDNLPKGYSYFYSEVKRVKEAAHALREAGKILVIFDELFKGTNVKDAFDGSLLIIKELVKWKSGFFILSSHLLELGNEIAGFDEVRFMCFDSRLENGKPYFNFKIKEGLSDERLGLIILQNENVFNLLNPDFIEH